jgi:hypothetical protein
MKYLLLISQGTALETQAALPPDEQATVWRRCRPARPEGLTFP